jgi:hypothetical protein
MACNRVIRTLFILTLALVAIPICAQQTGSIAGKVTSSDGQALPGVTVEAKSVSLPQPRTTYTGTNGDYRLPALQPGSYTVTFSLAGMQTQSRKVNVLLSQEVDSNVTLGMSGVAENITVTAESSLVDANTTSIKSAVTADLIQQLPVGQEYRDLIKLAPAVQYTEDLVRGPSAGGSGQDNVYQFDGVNVTLPLFGTLSAEPSSHDIAQLSVIKGGSKAIDFNRAAGFTIDSVSKSGTSELIGEVGYQVQTEAMRGDVVGTAVSQFDQKKDWLTLNVGGPLLRDRLFFYGSYYRPTIDRTKRTNAYGELPDYQSTRDEFFGKLTYTPLSSILLNGSYRKSDHTTDNASIGGFAQPSTALNEDSSLKVAILEGSWVVNNSSFASMKYTDFANETSSIPGLLVSETPNLALGTHLNIANLPSYGRFAVPTPVSGATAYNQFIQTYIDQYGYLVNGVRTGGGQVGSGLEINDQDFFRKSAQAGYDFTLGSVVPNDLHVGFQWSKDSEELTRSSNGYGTVSVIGGRANCPAGTACAGQPVFFQTQFTRSLLGGAVGGNKITSEYVSKNLEANDTIRWNNWSFNLGVMVSNDQLFGQGLAEDDTKVSGYVAAPGKRYMMYEIPWSKTIQPRLGATWSYNGSDNVYASFAKYVPAASSLPRAASWDRSILGLTSRGYYDSTGTLIGSDQVGSSSGKFFVKDMTPRTTNEYLIGTSQQLTSNWSARAYGRYRYSSHFWEDTNNDARVRWAPDGYPKELYIPDLADRRAQVGGSSYVIAELDGAFSKYYEATFESDWRHDRVSMRGSYTWSHYYGNFDQDNTSLDGNDSAIFIGSSNIGDGVGLQMWDNKYGDLRGDRRHLLKMYGAYSLGWNASVGAFGIYQSGQPWEAWNYEIYQNIPGFSGLNDLNRYAEPAGRRRSPAHYQVDLTYTQNVPISAFNMQFQLDAFNIFDKQTGYNFEPSVHRANFGKPRDNFDPRRYQIAVRFQF